jgi:hypothetical protein
MTGGVLVQVSNAEQFEESCGGDVVGASDAQDAAGELAALGELVCLGASDA